MTKPASVLTERFDEALAYAADVHRAQMRKGTSIPYLSHLMAVASTVLEDGADETTAIVALLHDAVEDQGGDARLADIRSRFGDDVAFAVSECSAEGKSKTTDWRPRKERYIAQMRTALPPALHVSLADKLHNLRSIVDDYRRVGDDLWQRFNAPDAGALVWYYDSLIDVYDGRYDVPNRQRIYELRRLLATLQELLRGPKCWRCGSADVIPILLGLPGPELMRAEAAGEVILLGCIPSDDMKNCHCRNCGYEWEDPAYAEDEDEDYE